MHKTIAGRSGFTKTVVFGEIIFIISLPKPLNADKAEARKTICTIRFSRISETRFERFDKNQKDKRYRRDINYHRRVFQQRFKIVVKPMGF